MSVEPPEIATSETGLDAAAIPEARSILKRTALGATWIIAWRFATRFIGMGSTLVLVRLLTPEDFGIVALATGFLQGLDAVAGFGVEGAIIRSDRADRAVYDSGFTINVARGVFTGAVMAAAATPVARFFNNMDLVLVIYVLAASWAIGSFQNIGMVEYRRQMAFDMEFKIKIIPRVLALAVTIPGAFIWHSYWALVAGLVATQVTTVVLSYMLHPYRPRFGTAGMRHIFGFSFWEWVIGLMNLVSSKADTVIIGRLLGPAAVGIYGVGGEIASLPSGEIVAPLCRALFSGFVAGRREGDDGAATLVRVMAVLALLTFPLNVGLSLVAYPVIKIAFGAEWLGAVPLVQVLGISMTISVLSAVGETLFSAHAWLKTLLWMTASIAGVRLVLLLVLIPRYGLLGGALAAAGVGVLQEAIYLATGMRRLKISALAVLRSVLRPALACAAMATVLAASGLGWNSRDGSAGQLGLELAEAVVAGACVYGATLLLLWLAAGRPAGPEADALAMARRAVRR